MRKIGLPVLILALVALDQLVKWWTVKTIGLSEIQAFIPNFISLTHLRNYGGAYSILQNQQLFFIITTIFVIGVALYYLIKQIKGSLWLLLSLSVVIAGGLGNFIDRIRLGYVVDMLLLDFIDFPIFNVADICVTLGVASLFMYMLKEEKNASKS